ncbi:polyprotein [Phytophthora megakarya]|uniref:Polyprotein n=1 Tax=Phytophthora megakarya TaxID=4795 RepID=A0A225V0C9_9STRA|nr:polyprotein [Phytophthora megakarya]
MRMTLARKGLHSHVEVVKRESEETEVWLTRDAKALSIIAQGVELQHQTKIRSATRAMQAWNTLREFYNRTTVHNRVTMTCRLHEFKIENGSTIWSSVCKLNSERTTQKLVVLLSSLPAEYELISSIVEDAQDITLNDVKDKLLKEYERLEKKKPMERAFKVVNAGHFKGGRAHGRKGNSPRKNGGGFKGKCFKCN